MSENPVRVVIDTQVFLRSAIKRQSISGKLLFDLADSYQLVTSDDITAEVEDVLNRPELRTKFSAITDEVVAGILAFLEVAEIVNPDETPRVSRDSKDDMVLACAKSAQVDYLISEDNDLLVLNPYEGIPIVRVFEFVKILEEQQ